MKIQHSAGIADAARIVAPSSAFGTFSPKGGKKGLSRVVLRVISRTSRCPKIESPSPPRTGEKVPTADEGVLFAGVGHLR
jgi:hypothetical protein